MSRPQRSWQRQGSHRQQTSGRRRHASLGDPQPKRLPGRHHRSPPRTGTAARTTCWRASVVRLAPLKPQDRWRTQACRCRFRAAPPPGARRGGHGQPIRACSHRPGATTRRRYSRARATANRGSEIGFPESGGALRVNRCAAAGAGTPRRRHSTAPTGRDPPPSQNPCAHGCPMWLRHLPAAQFMGRLYAAPGRR